MPRSASSRFISAFILAEVPTGTVLLVTSMVYLLMLRPNVRATSSTYFRSALPSSSGGVPTALNTTSTSSRHSFRSVVKCSRPSFTLRDTRSSSPGSYMGIVPLMRLSILRLSMSTHVTSMPTSAKQAPDTRPTYPVPTIAIFIFSYNLMQN